MDGGRASVSIPSYGFAYSIPAPKKTQPGDELQLRVNPHGLDAPAQITTCADMAKLLVDAIERPAISSVWGRATYNMEIIGPNARTQQISSSIKMIEGDDVLGGKTGTLRPKTYNLAIYSQTTSGAKLASVILRSPSDGSRYADMWLLLSALDDV